MPVVEASDEFKVDGFGNIYARVGQSKSLMVAHTDTVHRTDGVQNINYDVECGLVYKPHGEVECLGADNGSGCCLLLEMIEGGVPGWYLFARSEERGGCGSRFAVDENPEFFRQFDRAVAFDRRGIEDVITHQAGGRCCSNEFAEALARQINLQQPTMLDYKPCDGGIFTDTANMTHLVPECTNVACCYYDEHTAGEYLDVDAWLRLRDSLLNVDWESLPAARDPSKIESGFNWYSGGLAGEDLKFMTRKELKAWVRSSSAAEIASAIEDLLIELEGHENLSVQDTESEFESEPYYE